MPHDFVKMHRQFGNDSHLITLYPNTLHFDEDICLNFRLPTGKSARKWRDSKIERTSVPSLKYSKPKNIFESVYFSLRDELNKSKVNNAIKKYGLFDYDVYHFDGGMDFFRDIRFARELKRRGKKIICCYYGSDLRTRGIFRDLDEISDLNLTVEFDHLQLHKNIQYIFFPFNVNEFSVSRKQNKKIKIIHSPTNRKFKGTDKILKVISEIDKMREIEFILLENVDREKVLEMKSGCDIAIDQVGGESGGTGYGKNSIENLSMGIPTITEFSEDYLKFLRENPFIHSTIETLKDKLIGIIDNENLRNELSVNGRKWAEKFHSYEAVQKSLEEYYVKYKII